MEWRRDFNGFCTKILSFGALLALVTGGSDATFAAEAVYQRKPASFWLDCWDTNTGAALIAFKAMGTNAVPFLIKTLEQKPSGLGKFVDQQVTDYDLKHPPGVPRQLRRALPSAYRMERRRETAAFFLSELGPAAEAAIPTLFRIFTDTNEGWRVESEVSGALGAMGEKGVVLLPYYLSWLTNSDPEIQRIGASFLGSIGPKARVAVPELAKATDSVNRDVATEAAVALWSIDRQTNLALRVHTRYLQHTNSTYRQVAIIYLGKMGPAAREAAPLLEPFLCDPDSTVREQAEKALLDIDPRFLELCRQRINKTNGANVGKLIQLLQDGEFREKYEALELIGLYGPAAKSAVPALIAALDGFAPASTSALSLTAKMNTQRQAGEALAEIGPQAEAAVPALVARLWVGSYFQGSFCKALGRIGPPAGPAVPVLEKALENDNPQVRLLAADALTRIVPNQCSNAVAVLRALQHDPGLARVWRVDTNGIASQTEVLDFENPQSRMFRLSAAVPLWKLHLEPQCPVTALLEEMDKPENANALWCVQLLGDLGPDARAALPRLSARLEPPTWISLRRAAAMAIRKIDSKEADKLNLPGTLAVP